MSDIEVLTDKFRLSRSDAESIVAMMGVEETVVSDLSYSFKEWLKARLAKTGQRLIAVTKERNLLWVFFEDEAGLRASPFEFKGDEPLLEFWRACVTDDFKMRMMEETRFKRYD